MNFDEIDPDEIKKTLTQALAHLDKGEVDKAEEQLLRYRALLQGMYDNLKQLLESQSPPTQEPGTPREEKGEDEIKKTLTQALAHLDKGEVDKVEEQLLRYRALLQGMYDNLPQLLESPPTQEPGTLREEKAKPEKEES